MVRPPCSAALGSRTCVPACVCPCAFPVLHCLLWCFPASSDERVLFDRFNLFEAQDEDGNLVEADHDLGQVKIGISRDVLQQSRPGDDEDGKLSSGWVSKVTPEGRIFYMNRETRQTQWNHPAMDAADLPDGWEKQVDGDGRTVYVDIKSGKPGASVCHSE